VKPWHYPAAVGFGLVGAMLGFAGEIAGAVFEAVGLKVLCRLDATRLSGNWTALWRRVTARECLSLGAFLQPLIGGVLIGLWNVLQPYCLGEGTNFFQYLFLGVNQHTLKPKTMIGIGFVKLFATRTALGFGFVGGKFFPTMFLGGCVACAIYRWCNPDADSIVELSASDAVQKSNFAALLDYC